MKKLKTLLSLLTILLVLILTPALSKAGEDVTFTWDPYTSDPVDGFKLYMASAPGVPIDAAHLVATIPGQTTTTFKQLAIPAGMHYWVLTAFKGPDLESGPSNEVAYKVRLRAPGGLKTVIVITGQNMTVYTVAKE